MKLDYRIYSILKDIGIPMDLLGYRYWMEAIRLVYEDESLLKRITRSVYPVVA